MDINNSKPVGNSILKKFFMILLSLLILLIPMGFLFSIVDGRETYRNEAVENVSKAWASEQVIGVPELIINKKSLQLEEYNVNAGINTEIRKKGIFKIPVYTADIKLSGTFKNTIGNLQNANAVLSFNVKDVRGFTEAPHFKLGNNVSNTVGDKTYTSNISTSASKIPFEISYKLRGVNSFYVIPAGGVSNLKISGNWANPSFEGSFLPVKKEILADKFSAEWTIPLIAVGTQSVVNNLEVSTIKTGVSLLTPVDNYRMAQRCVKYAFLFLVLTFMSYFVFEITSKDNKRIHPIQYMLIGVSMLIFYLLLTSISEFIPFGLAYTISTLLTIGLIGLYTNYVLVRGKCKTFTVLIVGILSALYIFLYTLLLMQDLSLILGSFLLFIIIASIMYATRNVEWYE